MANSKQNNRRKQAPALTPEQQAEVLAQRQKAASEAKAEQERVHSYGKTLEGMSYRQIRGELRRTIKREYAGRPPEPQAGLNIALGAILLTVLENTQTKENPFAKLSAYPR